MARNSDVIKSGTLERCRSYAMEKICRLKNSPLGASALSREIESTKR